MSFTGENIVIQRHRVGSLSIYEITDHELDMLCQGAPGSVFLNIAIFCISSGLSLLAVLLTTENMQPELRTVFSIVAVMFGTAGAVLIILWGRAFLEVGRLVKKIKERSPT